MSSTSLTAAALAHQGRFEEALQQLRRESSDLSPSVSPSLRLEHAELLERTGRLAESRALLSSIRKSRNLTLTEQARGFLLDGLLLKQFGHLPEAATAFRRASDLAGQAGSSELLSWSQLRLLGVTADGDGIESTGSLLADVRRNTERAAEPTISIAYHIFTAEYQAKHGQLVSSRHHSDLAESLLASYPNAWLRGLLDLQRSCLSYLEGSFLDALSAARRALDDSEQSGHVLTRLIALADMSAAYLAIGQPARAEACLDLALRQANHEEQIFGLLLESLAEAQLLNRDFAGCAASLKHAEELAKGLAQSRSSWHRAWNIRTEARLLQRFRRWPESLELLRGSGPTSEEESGSFAKYQIAALEALALTHAGTPHEASQAVLELLRPANEIPGLGQGISLAAAASLLSTSEETDLARAWYIRALRVLGATGESSGLVELVDQFIELLALTEPAQSGHPSARSLGPLWRPTQVVCHLGTSSPVWPRVVSRDADTAAFMHSLPDLRADPRALGEETLRFLAQAGWIEYGVVRQSMNGRPSSVTCSYEIRALDAACPEPRGEEELPVRLLLGTKQARRYELLLSPADSPMSAIRCGGIARLVAALLASESSGRPRPAQAVASEEPAADCDESGIFLSPAMIALVASAKRVAPLDITILLTGESGTGKEVIANMIHRTSGRPPDSFVAFNCATVPREMVDSQLFGYRRGAFTGAVQSFNGVIGAADGGTLFLDEVGELPIETQPKLLRFLDSGEIQRLGDAVPQRVKVRVLAATNADLESLMKQGRFREDLYYRLNVLHLRVPPLRERRDEIGPLASRFLSRYAEEFGKSNVRLSDEAIEHLLLFAWPGNVRQLSHEMRRLAALQDSDSVVQVCDLNPEVCGPPQGSLEVSRGEALRITVRVDGRLADVLREVEKAAVSYSIGATGGRLDLAAKRLGLSRKGLYLKRQRLGFTGDKL